VTEDVMNSVIAFFMLFFLTLGSGAVLLVLIGLDPVTAISGAAATLSNVGPGLGPIIGPAGNFASLPDAAKWVLAFLMLAGRLELLTVYVVFTAAFWRG
jgi:trk system potassium uptake protein TrkH